MLPRNRLARKQLTKLKVYAGPEHPHQAQKPRAAGDRDLSGARTLPSRSRRSPPSPRQTEPEATEAGGPGEAPASRGRRPTRRRGSPPKRSPRPRRPPLRRRPPDEAPAAEEPPAEEARHPAEDAPAAEQDPAERPRSPPRTRRTSSPAPSSTRSRSHEKSGRTAEETPRCEAEEEERARREASRADADGTSLARRARRRTLRRRPIQATGKRKSSVARVRADPGNGAFEVNDRTIDDYFPRPYLQSIASSRSSRPATRPTSTSSSRARRRHLRPGGGRSSRDRPRPARGRP